MGKSLLIVESPTKIDTLKKIIGKGFTIKASVGHLKDLPKKKLGVDIENDFKPDYITIRGKGKILAALKAAAKKADDIYLAPDPDREGEAIAYHIANEVTKLTKGKVYRVMFNELTKKAVTEALKNPIQTLIRACGHEIRRSLNLFGVDLNLLVLSTRIRVILRLSQWLQYASNPIEDCVLALYVHGAVCGGQ